MVLFFTILIIVLAVAIAMWNLVPSWREYMRGYSTWVEAATTAIVGYGAWAVDWYGSVVESIQDTEYAEYVPENIAAYIPIAILIWMAIKRKQTKTPAGEKLED